MARKTMEERFELARKKYESELKVIGKELADSIAAMLAPLIPEGWMLHWYQADDCYNDEDYYFGVQNAVLCSEKQPRQGKCLREEVEAKYEEREIPPDYYYTRPRKERVCVQAAVYPKYEWILDDECEERDTVESSYEEEPGVVSLKESWKYAEASCGLLKKNAQALIDAFESLDNDDLRRAFGDKATVTICRDGTCEVE